MEVVATHVQLVLYQVLWLEEQLLEVLWLGVQLEVLCLELQW